MHILWKVPWALPVLMTVWNVFYVVATLLCEGRLRVTPLKFAVMYASTIESAMRGELEPFMAVFTLPG